MAAMAIVLHLTLLCHLEEYYHCWTIVSVSSGQALRLLVKLSVLKPRG